MKKRLSAGLLVTVFLGFTMVVPASAGCRDAGGCGAHFQNTKTAKAKLAAPQKKLTTKTARKRLASARKGKRGPVVSASRNGGQVVTLIQSMAPAHGVPTWFALRIAKVESNYNPRARGAAGELGVFQLKCSTAKGIGYRGSCAGLLDARTNVQYGLKHLSLAMKSSGGNLKLAASKHNGGLGRKTMVHGYVAKVF